jgi:phosphoglycerate dehydrogenase-like enzyme/catechol 2,3-dioxygenase-like lactoylglutathione lyase family enzyme
MKILHIDDNHPVLKLGLEKLGCKNEEDFSSSKEDVESKIHLYEGVVIRSRFKIDKQFIDKASNLKFIARVGAGLESIDVDCAAEKGIQLISAPEGNRNAVGEHALGMLLSLFNKIKQADIQIRNGKWLREENRGLELDGKIIGLIGYGNMGKSFAKKLRGFDVEVLCYDIQENVGDENCRQTTLTEIQEKADVLSIHTPFNTLSDKMINWDIISHFKKSFYLINTARGSAVVTEHLVQAMQMGKIAGACLDVLEYEKGSFENLFENKTLPTAFEYLIQSEDVLLSPHVAGWTVESKVKLAQTCVDKIAAHFFNIHIKPQPQDTALEKVTGIGGVFFKTDDPEKTRRWYQKHLGFNIDPYGTTFWWKDNNQKIATTQWSPFTKNTKYFDPSKKDYMFNYRVKNLDQLLIDLENEGIQIIDKPEIFSYGKFAWILDLDGNKVELWEPLDSTFE